MKWPFLYIALAPVTALAATHLAAPPATTQPARITLHANALSVPEVIQQLSAQAGANLPLSPPDLLIKDPLPPVTMDVENQPFWTALEALGNKTGLEPVFSPEDPYPRFQLGRGGGSFWEEPHVVAGPVVLFANEIQRTNTVELHRKNHRFEREFTINLTAFVEPGIKLLWTSPQVTLKLAVDDQGQSLAPPADHAKASPLEDGPEGGLFMWNLEVPLHCPEKPSHKIARLVGQTLIRCQTAFERIEIEDVLKARNVARKVADVPFTFQSLKKADIEYVLRLSLDRNKKPERDWQNLRHSIYNGQLALYDRQGRLVAGRGTENGGDYGETRINATLRFIREPGLTDPQAGEPFKLVWLAPTASKDLLLDFEFDQLPIPD